MAKLSTAKATLIATLFATNKTDAEIAKEAKVALSTVKNERMAFQAKQAEEFAKKPVAVVVDKVANKVIPSHYQAVLPCTIKEEKPAVAPKAMNKMAQMAAAAKANAPEIKPEADKPAEAATPELSAENQAKLDQMLALQKELMEAGAIQQPAPAATRTRAAKVTKDLTKRDVVCVVSDALKQAYICTSVKYSGVGEQRGGELLKADMLKRASLVELANADDFKFIIVSNQVEHTESQTSKLRAHLSYEAKGYTMKSTKGRGAEVKAILAKLQAEAAAAPETATEAA